MDSEMRLRVVENGILQHVTECAQRNKAQEEHNETVISKINALEAGLLKRFDYLLLAIVGIALSSVFGVEGLGDILKLITGRQ